MVTAPRGVHPDSVQPGGHLRRCAALQGGLTAALPQHRPFSTRCFILNSAKSPTVPRCSRMGFCYLCSAELAGVWLACLSHHPLVLLVSHWQLLAFFRCPLFPERKKIAPETWESTKKFLCLKASSGFPLHHRSCSATSLFWVTPSTNTQEWAVTPCLSRTAGPSAVTPQDDSMDDPLLPH